MNEPSTNPVWVALFCIARCVVPLFLLLLASYIIKKLGLVAEPPQPPPENESNSKDGGYVNGSA